MSRHVHHIGPHSTNIHESAPIRYMVRFLCAVCVIVLCVMVSCGTFDPQEKRAGAKPISQAIVTHPSKSSVSSHWLAEDFAQTNDGSPLGERLRRAVHFDTLMDVMPCTSEPAIRGANLDGTAMKHMELQRFLENGFDLRPLVPPGARIAIVLPNGPGCALILVACVATHCCVPLSPDAEEEEIIAVLDLLRCAAVVCTEGSSACRAALSRSLVRIYVPTAWQPGERMTFSSPDQNRRPSSSPEQSSKVEPPRRTGRASTALIIMTSGSTGNRKVVLHSLEGVVIGAMCIARSWALSPSDVSLNIMPLFHIGGITRSLFAAILSGGSVCCTPGFDASMFWDLVKAFGITWYYAGPTNHEMILREGALRQQGDSESTVVKLRFIGNAAGHLTNELAERLHATFNCHVLPSYGCTEAMPITSPPANYNLEKPGSSGKPCGPEVVILDDYGKKQPPNQLGHIVVRGCPVMQAYEGLNDSGAFSGDFLRTGDVGYLDNEGWLFITGRSKEVINRGGEILSPAEIEEALIKYPGVKEAVAFVVVHDTLQETVGAIFVVPEGVRRPDLRALHSNLSGRLHPSKWPQLLIFMDALPRGQTMKVIRSKISQRCKLPTLTDEMPTWLRHWEAKSPPPGTPLTEEIPCWRLKINECETEDMCMASGLCTAVKVCWVKARGREVFAAHVRFKEAFTHKQAKALLEYLDTSTKLHDYELPSLVVPLADVLGPLPVMQHWRGERYVAPAGDFEITIAKIWQDSLQPDGGSGDMWLSADGDFFEVGGSSLLAGGVISRMRAQLRLPLAAQLMYSHRTVREMASHCQNLSAQRKGTEKQISSRSLKDMTSTKANSQVDEDDNVNDPSAFGTLLQFVPLLIFVPMARILQLGILTKTLCLSSLFQGTVFPHVSETPVWGIMFLLICLSITALIKDLVFPLVLILLKWLVIGKYREGRYPVYGSMYLRWWFVDIMQSHVLGPGIFSWDMPLFYRLLGARIGRGAKISGSATLSEYDLITVGAGASVDDYALIRGFGLSRGSMILRPVAVGVNSQVCHRSIVAPGHVVPDRSHVHIHSSSYDVAPGSAGASYAKSDKAEPCMALKVILGQPILATQWFASNAFSLYLYVHLIMTVVDRDFASWEQTIGYLVNPKRIKYFFLLPIARNLIKPLIELLVAMAVKRCLLGKIQPGPQNSEWARFRRWMLVHMLSADSQLGHACLPRVLELFGSHFQITTWIYRGLGMKAGERIYWPGRGLSTVDFDLIEVGDDVIFGSRSHFIACDAFSARPIRIESGAMVADRCVLLPGCTIGKNAMLGSGGLGPADTKLPADSLWVGSHGGKPIELHNSRPKGGPTLRRFGKAFYKRQASFFVWPLAFHLAYSLLWHMFLAVSETIPFLLTLVCVHTLRLVQTGELVWSPTATMFLSQIPSVTHHFVLVVCCVGACVKAAWVLFLVLLDVNLVYCVLGRRTPGTYNWDETSFCQRWLLARCVHKVVNDPLDCLRGTPMMNKYFRMHGASIGAGCCLYPTGADPYMTEPDLVKLGDGVCVDKASLVAHSNTFGEYELRTLEVGKKSTLRTGSRLISGAKMEDHSEILEHTLILPGDEVPKFQACQGWPASEHLSLFDVEVPPFATTRPKG